MNENEQKGALIIIGGAENRSANGRILQEFVKLSGGEKAIIAVVAVASRFPIETSDDYKRVFTELGAAEIEYLEINEREDAMKPDTIEIVKRATGVFFTGGNQNRITQMLAGTKIDEILHRRNETDNLIIAGTSAGAAMMSNIMIAGGMPEYAFFFGTIELRPGMNFLPGVLIDQHFEQRGRLRRLLAAVAEHSRDLGVGIDEDTAIIVEKNAFRVIGEGTVTVVDASDVSFTNMPELGKDELLTLFGVKVHILAPDYRFDLRKRTPLLIVQN